MYRYNSTFQSKIRNMEIQKGQIVRSQEKDVEIERLQTTCYTLNKQVVIMKDLQEEIKVLKK